MPGAAASERRRKARSRATGPDARPRARGARAAAAPVASKLRAVQGVGLTAGAAGAVAGLLAVLILVAALATDGRASRLMHGMRSAAGGVARASGAVLGQVHGLIEGRFADLGFRVETVRLQGASAASRDQILRAAAVARGAPILGLDLAAIRARVERVGWVERARVIRLLPATLVIAVDERPLMAVWQRGGRLAVVDVEGRIVGAVDPGAFPGLPRIVGEGANSEAGALLGEVRRRPALIARLGWLRRVDARRWDLILKDGGVIQLPETGETAALDRLDRLDRVARVLELGLERLDLRDPDFTVAHPRGAAAAPVARGA